MNEITSFCHSFKKDFTSRKQDSRQPVHHWSEKDILHKKVVDAYVLILRTQGCSWALSSGCTMCGYFNDSLFAPVSEEDLLAQFNTAMKQYKDEKIVKIFTSGSFLDPHEISGPVQQKILGTLAEKAEKISVESRPEYITEKTISAVQTIAQPSLFEVGIGLETSNDVIREKAINKGFTFDQYHKAALLLKKHQMSVKTYVLLKPPFVTEKESLNDCLHTIKDISSLTDIISINPTNVQHHTVVEYLWKREQYRPAWLWSVAEVLQQSKNLTNAVVKCDVVGGGSIRGAHNCGVCDRDVLDAIEQFSLSQKPNVFDALSCSCKNKWLDQLDVESLSFGSCVDFGRWNS